MVRVRAAQGCRHVHEGNRFVQERRSAVRPSPPRLTLDLPYLRDVGRGPRFDLGAEFAPNFLGGWNDLEGSENCRSAGGHGNQHVRLRSAQIDRIEAIGPARPKILASSRGRRPAINSNTLGRCQMALRGVERSKRLHSCAGTLGFGSTAPSVRLTVRLAHPGFDAERYASASVQDQHPRVAPNRKFYSQGKSGDRSPCCAL
jgi:hypothetical protein